MGSNMLVIIFAFWGGGLQLLLDLLHDLGQKLISILGQLLAFLFHFTIGEIRKSLMGPPESRASLSAIC